MLNLPLGKEGFKGPEALLQLLYAKLDAGFAAGDLFWKDTFVSGRVRLALRVLVCVPLLVSFYERVCNLGITPAKWGNVLSPMW